MADTKSTTQKVARLRRELVDAVGVLLTQARSALFITGPALTMEAGLRCYRGIPGLTRKKPEDGKLFETALSTEVLAAKPETTWKYLLGIEAAVRAARPGRGHEILVELERALGRTTIMTVNVDRLHQRAGSRNVIEMHGALHDLLCKTCELSSRHDSFEGLAIPPRCATCGSVLRPDMPLFGEPLPVDPFTRLQAELDEGFDMVFAVGVGKMYSYLARPLLLAKQEGIPTIEIGNEQTDLSDVVDFRFRSSPSRVLEMIWQVYQRLGRVSREKLARE
jgi:NAD-dependent deacetylase